MSQIKSEATAYRSHSGVAPGKNLYAVHFDGSTIDYIIATDLPQARGIVRKALRAAFRSAWNQSLIFRGILCEGEVSRTSFRSALSKLADKT